MLFFIGAKRARLARAEGIALKIIPPKTKSITQVTTQHKLIVSQKNAIGKRRASPKLYIPVYFKIFSCSFSLIQKNQNIKATIFWLKPITS